MPRLFLSWSFMQGSRPALMIPSCFCLSPPAPPQPPRPRPPCRPARFSLHPPQLPSPHDPPKLPCLREVPEPPTLQLPPPQTPLVSSCSREKKNRPDLALCVPQRQRRRLPVTPLPPASYRHRLPQQPANCSATTSLPIG